MASGEGCSASVVAGRGTAARTAPPLSGASEIDAVGRTVGPVAEVPTGKRVDKWVGSAVAGRIGAASVSSDDLEAAWLPVKEAGVSVSAGNRRNYPGYQQQDNPFCGPFHRPTVGPVNLQRPAASLRSRQFFPLDQVHQPTAQARRVNKTYLGHPAARPSHRIDYGQAGVLKPAQQMVYVSNFECHMM
mgnify:CR=1 FL=1